MIIDFHSHVKISKKSMFMPEYFQEMMKEAKASGLTSLVMTEHFNTRRFYDIFEYIDSHYSMTNGYYMIEGLKLFPGIEVDVKENGHILLIGTREDVLFIREKLADHLDEGNFIAFDQLMLLADQKEMLKIGAHPYRKSTPLAKNVTFDQLKKLDALDLNGKDLYAKGTAVCQMELEQLAEKIQLPIVGGSDTHQFLQYGSIVNEFAKDCETVSEIKEEILAGNYTTRIEEQLNLKVKAATLVKKYMKKSLIEQTVTV
ncbi:PHP domain-containing protein [Gracilibacillus oryzae]|uniref:PHP domain-containing protein n=1 Tax=Gracilibacillus oryzae TaxID=1672701 RepID=A0A7C8GV30_9BACI|nr:PHP-associated domain-containing protein [Gracilibacillus oryzae]KAB8138913.1 PHP domain-containing protein [Gracilibacillus oryzae]